MKIKEPIHELKNPQTSFVDALKRVFYHQFMLSYLF